MADWSLLGNFLEEVQEHSTSVGKVWHKNKQKKIQYIYAAIIKKIDTKTLKSGDDIVYGSSSAAFR